MRLTTVLQKRGPAAAIVLTDEQVAELGPQKAFPVKVTIGDRSAQLRLARMGGENLVGLSKASRTALAVEVGDEVEVEIVADDTPRTIEVPPELATAIDDAGLGPRWDALAPSHRKEHARSVADAKQEATRERRIAKVIDALRT